MSRTQFNTRFEVLRNKNGVPVKAWTKGVPFEDEARDQLLKLSTLPFVFSHIAVMPDVHAGKGSTVGSVIATDKVIIPASVGVDIGCGMIAVKTNLKASDLPDNLKDMRTAIEEAVPHGGPGEKGSWREEPLLNGVSASDNPSVLPDFGVYDRLCIDYPEIESKYALRQFGTLGTGNHFVEVCLDESQNVWVMLHSGSRGAGNRIGTFFIEKAKEEMQRWFVNLPDTDLAYLPEGSQYYDDYIAGVEWAQEYAHQSRQAMMHNTLFAMAKALGRTVLSFSDTAVNCHHNYIAKENHFWRNVWVTRKGAVRARAGDLGIIPGSMGARSYIVRGLGNPESFMSCSHGAGRKMSRTQANKTFTLADHKKATEGVECRKDAGVIDETPGAYKDIDAVMAAQSDLVEVVATLKQVLCVKG